MSYPLLEAFADGLRLTVPFNDLPAKTRSPDVILIAHDRTNMALRQPLYSKYLRKPHPKMKVFDTAIQSGLAILASFAHAAGTRQAIVRLESGQREAVSFQPRPFNGNWTRVHAISPALLQSNFKDPLPRPDEALAPAGMMSEMSTRGILHLAGKTAMAIARSLPGEPEAATVTFTFETGFMRPHARAVFRPLAANKAAHVIELAQ
jgi:hypothetical protein